jgi:23S rRNA (pseudouridine1915-N3)-methyltransferase
MRELVVAWVGRPRQDAWEELCADYRERIARQVPIRDLPIRVRHRGEDRQRLRKEGRALLTALPEPCWLVALDRRGRAPSTLELARDLAQRLESWPHAIAFAGGSGLGLDPAALDSAHQKLSLSRLTLPHQLARLLLYEQLYRALSLAAGIQYHRLPL